jgi:hypothetical protein
MKVKKLDRAFEVVRELVHEWKPVPWATYDDDEPVLPKDDPGYKAAKSMLSDETDSMVMSIVKQLPRVKTENDLAFLLHKTFGSESAENTLELCKGISKELYLKLNKEGIV